MNKPKCNEYDYINFLVATPRSYSCVEAASVQPESHHMPSHDAFTRLLTRLEPDAATLWQEAQSQVVRQAGVLIIDDSTLDKPYARQIELAGAPWYRGNGKRRSPWEPQNRKVRRQDRESSLAIKVTQPKNKVTMILDSPSDCGPEPKGPRA